MTTATAPIPFAQARRFKLPYGRHKDEELDDVARTDRGLLYLDWLLGECEKSQRTDALRQNLEAYLSDKTIARDVQRLSRHSPRQNCTHRD